MSQFALITDSGPIPLMLERERRILAFFERISASTATLSGEAFFKMLVSEIASILNVNTVFISRYPGQSQAHFRTIVFWRNGDFCPNVDFELQGRPCKSILEGEVCFYPRGLEALFPREKGFQSFLGLPLRRRDQQIIGHVAILHDQPLNDEQDYIAPLQLFAARAAMELEREYLWQDLQIYEERSRLLSRELHDAVSQTLWIANLFLEQLPAELHQDVAQAEQRIQQLQQMMQAAHSELRALLLELRPRELQDVPLGELMRNLADTISARSGVIVLVNLECTYEFSLAMKTTIYRIIHEALNNVARHAHASYARVELSETGGTVLLTILDNGCGFDMDAVDPTHMGIQIMRERADSIGACFEIISNSFGTTIKVSWLIPQ